MTDPHDPDEQQPASLTFDPDGHLSVDSLADLDEGLLSDADAATARAHLAGCERCSADLAAVAAVRTELSEQPAPAMPDDVAARLHEALAAETPSGGASVTTLPSPRGPSRWQRAQKPVLVGTAAAAAIALIAFGAVHLPRSTSSKASSAAGSATSAAAPPVFHTGTDYKPGLATEALGLLSPLTAGASSAAGVTSAAAASAAAPASGAAAGGSSSSAGGSSSAASSAPTFGSASGGTGGLASASAAPAATSGAVRNGPAPVVPTLGPLTDPAAARQCLTSLAADAGALLAVDYGRFGAAPAVIGVFEVADDPSKLEVVAAGPGCVIDQVVFTTRP